MVGGKRLILVLLALLLLGSFLVVQGKPTPAVPVSQGDPATVAAYASARAHGWDANQLSSTTVKGELYADVGPLFLLICSVRYRFDAARNTVSVEVHRLGSDPIELHDAKATPVNTNAALASVGCPGV